MAGSIPMIFARGSHYEVFKQVGETFKDRIKAYIDNIKPTFLTKHTVYARSDDGKLFVEKLRISADEYYPEYMDELRGMAEGAGIPFNTIFLANLELDIMWEMGKNAKKEGKESCSDVLLNNKNELIISHNEDLSTETEGLCFLLCAWFDAYTNQQGQHHPSESLCAFMAPGILPGICFNINGHGFAYSVNTVYVPHARVTDRIIPEVFLQRSLATAKDISDAQKRMHHHQGGPILGININAGQLGVPDKLWSLEIGPDPETGQTATHLLEITTDHQVYGHFNGFQHSSLPYVKGECSESRMAQFGERSPPQTKQDILSFLSDTKDPSFPILRSAKPPDKGTTAFTALFNFKERMLSIYQCKISRDKPIAVIPMDTICPGLT